MPGIIVRPRRRRVTAYKPRKRQRRNAPVPTRAIMSLRQNPRRVFPEKRQHRTTLRYFGNFISINPGIGGVAAAHVFSANGLYDPDITGTGHQPVGFDELMALYDHYTVIGSKIRVYFQNNDTSNAQFAAVVVRDRTTVSTDTREIVENGYISMCHLATFGTGGDKGQSANSVDLSKFLGRSNALSDSQLKGSVSANPAEQVYYHVTAFPVGQVDSTTVTANVVIDYDVIFHEKTITLPS